MLAKYDLFKIFFRFTKYNRKIFYIILIRENVSGISELAGVLAVGLSVHLFSSSS